MSRTLIAQTLHQIGETITIQGWVTTRRDHGQVTFLDVRDRTGLLQVVNVGKTQGNPEDVVKITGIIKSRPKHLVNTKLATGTIELEAQTITILNPAKPLPFPIDTDGSEIKEDIRLKYRYLDLRRERLTKTLRIRSAYIHALRQELINLDFCEIETPLLTKATKEGARDFLVPSRLQPGKFYALPQSPQQYKQLLMVAGVERYFQFARCIRDEDLRADRGFEHTQLDLEMSFVDRQSVMSIVENLVKTTVTKVGGKLKFDTFPVIDYKDALAKYGNDKFDLRTNQEKAEGVLAFAWVVNFPFFKHVNADDQAELADGKSGWTFTHNPFSQPIPEHLDWHLKGENLDQIITDQYDLVCNGYEVGGGSIRAHQPEVLQATFRNMGYSPEETNANIGHMLEAFSYGAPPHGGIALGLDRHVMILSQQTSLKEAIAFPMSTTGRTAVMDAPSIVPPEQLVEIGIGTLKSPASNLPVFEQITQKLNQLKIKYQVLEHEPVFTSEQAAQIRDTNINQGAKALVMLADKKPIMVVVPGASKVDFKKFKLAYQIKDLEMAPRELVEQVTTVKIGAVPPLGSLFQLPTYVDENLAQNQQIAFNAGLHEKSIRISYSDYLRVEQPIIGNFSQSSLNPN